jgi:15-hydroxyprostaglandin dehydrogenase (NAD)
MHPGCSFPTNNKSRGNNVFRNPLSGSFSLPRIISTIHTPTSLSGLENLFFFEPLIFSSLNITMSKPVAIVTGAGSGIGEAVSRHLYNKGYKVVVADMNPTTGEKVASALGPDATFIQADVSSYRSQALLFKQAYKWGGNRLDFCHANAGIDDRQILYDAGEKEELDEEGLLKPLNTKTMQVNLEAVIQGLWLFKYYVRRSREAGGGKGKFVATSSAAGL